MWPEFNAGALSPEGFVKVLTSSGLYGSPERIK
jgi:hypothetical protein